MCHSNLECDRVSSVVYVFVCVWVCVCSLQKILKSKWKFGTWLSIGLCKYQCSCIISEVNRNTLTSCDNLIESHKYMVWYCIAPSWDSYVIFGIYGKSIQKKLNRIAKVCYHTVFYIQEHGRKTACNKTKPHKKDNIYIENEKIRCNTWLEMFRIPFYSQTNEA